MDVIIAIVFIMVFIMVFVTIIVAPLRRCAATVAMSTRRLGHIDRGVNAGKERREGIRNTGGVERNTDTDRFVCPRAVRARHLVAVTASGKGKGENGKETLDFPNAKLVALGIERIALAGFGLTEKEIYNIKKI